MKVCKHPELNCRGSMSMLGGNRMCYFEKCFVKETICPKDVKISRKLDFQNTAADIDNLPNRHADFEELINEMRRRESDVKHYWAEVDQEIFSELADQYKEIRSFIPLHSPGEKVMARRIVNQTQEINRLRERIDKAIKELHKPKHFINIIENSIKILKGIDK